MSTVLPCSIMSSRRGVLAPCLSLFLLVQLCRVTALPLDDTLRNGLYEDETSHLESAVYSALSSSSSSSNQPSVLETAIYLGIQQHMEAPELTNPPRMPQCISSSKVSKQLTAAINAKYAAQLTMNASVDTTYIQTLRKCDYNSFITLSGPEEVRSELVDAANANKLCDLLPMYCKALNLQPTPSPTTTAAKAAATAAGRSPHTSSSSSSSGSKVRSAEVTPAAPAAAQPIDDPRRRGIQRRSSISSTDPYILVSSSGTDNPDLPPVLDFKCVKHNHTQVLDHFPERSRAHVQRVDSEAPVHDGDQASTTADSHSLHWDSDSDLWETEAEWAANAKQQWRKQKTFTQVYWVCDAAWPKSDRNKQKQDGNVIVFLGNESPLGIPKQPIVFENARRLNALVVLVEHRYYGESLPYPAPENGRVPTEQYKWLTIQQVIEDTVSVVQHVRKERHIPVTVPNIVIGGSYGGMIASYHRVVRPDVFNAAVAASAPIYYVVDTKMWRHTSNRYHQFIKDSATTMSGSSQCSTTVREALEELLHLGRSAAGRQNITEAMRLCGTSDTALPNREAVMGLQEDIIGTFQGLAQVNNQPPVMGEMAIACGVINEATAAGRSALEAVAALYSYMGSNGSENWCYNFTYNADFPVLPDDPSGYNSYTYQCCAQGTVYSSELPARGSDDTLNPENIPVPVREIQENCRNIFGKHVPELHAPGFAQHIMPLLHEYGNVVFTNGDLDGWAGGSLGLLPVVGREQSSSSSAGSGALMYDIGVDLDAKNGGLSAHHSHVAFVVYRNASHCTDTHTNMWADPNEPAEWRKQRAIAMDYAVGFARSNKRETVV